MAGCAHLCLAKVLLATSGYCGYIRLSIVSVWCGPFLWVYVVGVDRYLPWQQLVDPADGVIGDSFQDVLEIDPDQGR